LLGYTAVNMMMFILVSLLCSVVNASPKPGSIFRDVLEEGKKEALVQELEEAQLLKELEILVKNLDDEQLEKLEKIMGKDIDETTEFDMIVNELKDMGMEDSDITDLKQLAQLMHEFLSQVPEIGEKLDFDHEYDLLDNIQLYLLGLPNKLGPLGYIALHHVLEEEADEGEVVDVVIEPVVTVSSTQAPRVTEKAVNQPIALRRRRESPLKKVIDARRGVHDDHDHSNPDHDHKY